MMANYYIDPAATGANNGTSPTDAWTSPIQIINVPANGDTIWVRRTVNHSLTSALAFTASGAPNAMRMVIGWPRGSFTSTGNFTNNNTSITSVSSPAVTWRRYGARWLRKTSETARYLITSAVDSGTVLKIDRPYGGSTETGAGFTVEADEDFSVRPQAGIDVGWDSDAQDLVRYYGAITAWMTTFSSAVRWWWFKNLYFQKTGSSNYGIAMFNSPSGGQGVVAYMGCIFNTGDALYWQNSTILTQAPAWTAFRRCILRGTNYDGQLAISASRLDLRDVSIQNYASPIYVLSGAVINLENVNLGIEASCYYDFHFQNGLIPAVIVGKDVWSGATATSGSYIPGDLKTAQAVGNLVSISIENWGKNLKQIFKSDGLRVFSMAVDTSTTDPRKRTNGSDMVLKVHLGWTSAWGPPMEVHTGSLFDQRIWATAGGSKGYRFYLQSLIAISSGYVTLEATYIDSHSSDTLWTEKTIVATVAISARSGNTDWSQYIEVTGISPAIACAVRLRLRVRIGSSTTTDYLYVDPKVLVT